MLNKDLVNWKICWKKISRMKHKETKGRKYKIKKKIIDIENSV